MSRAAEPYVFLSYSSRDCGQALAVADALEAAGVRVWIDRHAIAGDAVGLGATYRYMRRAFGRAVAGTIRVTQYAPPSTIGVGACHPSERNGSMERWRSDTITFWV